MKGGLRYAMSKTHHGPEQSVARFRTAGPSKLLFVSSVATHYQRRMPTPPRRDRAGYIVADLS